MTDIREVQFGFDGIVFASSVERPDFALTPLFIYQAIAAKVSINGALSDNPYNNWNQIDASLPNQKIALVIPGPNHGTREVFQERIVDVGCHAAGLPTDAPEDICTTFRQDVVVEIAGNYTETLARLDADPDAIGIFGLSFYDQNRDSLKAATIDDVTPSLQSIAAGTYPVSRPLFFYVKGQHIDTVPGIEDYVRFFLSPGMSGNGGALEAAGLIPQPTEKTATVLAAFEAGTTQ